MTLFFHIPGAGGTMIVPPNFIEHCYINENALYARIDQEVHSPVYIKSVMTHYTNQSAVTEAEYLYYKRKCRTYIRQLRGEGKEVEA